MATATFNTSEYTVPGTNRTVYLKYLLCSQKDIVVRSISGSVKDSDIMVLTERFSDLEQPLWLVSP